MPHNNRFYILLFSAILSLGIYLWVTTTLDEGVHISRLTQIFALTAVTFLYFTLLAGPLCYILPKSTFTEQYKHARRALGVSAFYFSLLHACIAFFLQLGGFAGLPYLSDTYIFNVTIGAISLLILYLLAITSFDFVIKKMTFPKWKILQRFVYLAGFLTLIHALMLGTHFKSLNEFIPQIFFSALAILLFLEAKRTDEFITKKFTKLPRFGLTATLIVGLSFGFYLYTLLPSSEGSPFSSHSQMKAGNTAQLTAMGMNSNTTMSQYPGMDGDKNKRYTTGFDYPEYIEPEIDVTLDFPIYDAANGKPVEYYKTVYEKAAHLIVVNKALSYFAHIHPEPTDTGFTINTQFPDAGEYHLYLSYQPLGAIEQQAAFTVKVGTESGTDVLTDTYGVDRILTKTFGDYKVTLDTPQPMKAKELSSGVQQIQFTIKDRSNKPVRTLKPYLGAFGHLVLINQNTYEYIHIHPSNIKSPAPNQNGGPQVSFLSLGMYGPIKPGTYRAFGQFNPDGNLFTADFTVEIK